MNTFDFFILPVSPILAPILTAIGLVMLECIPSLELKKTKAWIAIFGAVLSIACTFWIWKHWPINYVSGTNESSAAWLVQFIRSYKLDVLSLGFYAGIGAFTALSLVFMDAYFKGSEIRAEVFILTLFISSGMMLLVSADSLLMVFLGLELLSLPTYVLVGILRKDRYSCEAALKYFLFGSIATVLLVFGITLLYGQFGTLSIPKIADSLAAAVAEPSGSRLLAIGGLALLIIATGFKVGLVPFHMWLPDAYQGAPSPVTGFMGSAVKLAGFGLVARLLWGAFLPLSDSWIGILDTLALITMFVGNLAALAQDNLKRMFAYSSISHAGYLVLGITSLGVSGPNAHFLFYYLIVYGLMFLGLFAVIGTIEQNTKNSEIFQLAGMGFTHPVLSFCLALFSLSAAGIPPTAGFFAKYFIFLQAVKAGKTAIVTAAVISSLIGVYYYLRVLVYLYMKEPKERLTLVRTPRLAFFCILLCAASIFYFAVMPEHLGLGSLTP
jgi:NADH-quinone oxidoreductase subunit N